MRTKRGLVAVVVVAALSLVGCTNQSAEPAASSSRPQSQAPTVTGTVISGLEVPWGIAFLPDGTALVTERDSGNVLAISPNGQSKKVGEISEAQQQGEGGLLGVAVSPNFTRDQLVFFYYTRGEDNRVARTTYQGESLGPITDILTGIPAGYTHNGGRMTFGPDQFLYVGTGDAGDPNNAQDLDSLGGKILRITGTGDPAPMNPFGNSPVWSLGHRNVQGLAFDSAGRLWASEFGADDADELNRIVRGGNYGWPEVEGTSADTDSEYVQPALTWPPDTASPSGLAFQDGFLWMASLRGERLWRIRVTGNKAKNPTDFFVETFGRMRTVVSAPAGDLWVTTSNRDGRGEPRQSDDQILSINDGVG